MAIAPLSRDQRRSPTPQFVPALLIGAAALGASTLAAAPAKAQTCNAGSKITVKVSGTDYAICTIQTKAIDPILKQNTWFNDNQLARDFADAVLAAQNNPADNNPLWYPDVNTLNQKTDGPYFLWDLVGNSSSPQGKAVSYDWNGNNFSVNNGPNPPGDALHQYVLLTDLDPPNRVPGPLPMLGAGAAFGWSRRLRRRLKDKPNGWSPECCERSEPAAVQRQGRSLVQRPLRPVFAMPGRR